MIHATFVFQVRIYFLVSSCFRDEANKQSKCLLVTCAVFEYNPNFHNVLHVNHSDFQSCKFTAPIATYSTGKESITIKQPGHYYYICGIPGHCDVGQKVDIRVTGSSKPSLSPGPTPRSSPSPSTEVPLSGGSPKAAEVPSPSQSGVPALIEVQLWLAMGIAAVWLIVQDCQ